MKVQMIGDIRTAPKLKGKVVLPDGTEVDAEDAQTPISDEGILHCSGKCTECKRIS
jgi:hypothetical protein